MICGFEGCKIMLWFQSNEFCVFCTRTFINLVICVGKMFHGIMVNKVNDKDSNTNNKLRHILNLKSALLTVKIISRQVKYLR